MLYLVATPIGNLKDITYRAVEVLNACDLILCEDTRHSKILLDHYEIKKPLKSYHKFNEVSALESIIRELKNGKKIALISDAGTPGISDPGERLVQECTKEKITVVAIPGACAAICALSSSGLSTSKFQFIGFLPKKEQELQRCLIKVLAYEGTTACYESPRRLENVLQTLEQLSPEVNVVVARELTKKFEEIQRGTPSELLEYWESHPLKGEIVLMIEGNHPDRQDSMTAKEQVAWLEKTYELPKKEAIKLAAEIHGIPKRLLYNDLHSK